MGGPRSDDILVVGAGISGLTVAAEVAGTHRTTIIDRLPVIGGTTLGFEDPAVIDARKRCGTREVHFVLGTTAVRWSPADGLLLAGPVEGIRWLEGRHLVFSGGVRPSTAAELGLAGDRVTGIFAAPYAYHLMENGVQLGRHVIVVGCGFMAEKVAKQIVRQNGSVTIVTEDEETRGGDIAAAAWWRGWRPFRVHGKGRISEMLVARDGLEQQIDCDSVILAAKMRPLRNIDGAIFDGTDEDHVSFVQDVSEVFSIQDRVRNAEKKAQEILRMSREVEP